MLKDEVSTFSRPVWLGRSEPRDRFFMSVIRYIMQSIEVGTIHMKQRV